MEDDEDLDLLLEADEEVVEAEGFGVGDGEEVFDESSRRSTRRSRKRSTCYKVSGRYVSHTSPQYFYKIVKGCIRRLSTSSIGCCIQWNRTTSRKVPT